MNIEEYLNSHELISISSIERKIGLTKGTLKKNRTIPIKYVDAITAILKDYGYIPSLDNSEQTIIPEPIQTIKKKEKASVKPIIEKSNDSIAKVGIEPIAEVGIIDTVAKVGITNNSKYTFSGKDNRTCKYTDGKNIIHTVVITDDMINRYKMPGSSIGSFRCYPDNRTYYCVKAYLDI